MVDLYSGKNLNEAVVTTPEFREKLRAWWKKNIPEAGRQKTHEVINFFRDKVLTLTAFREMGSNYALFDSFLDDLDRKEVSGDLCEIGTFNGVGAAHLLSKIKTGERKLWVIDPFEDQDISDRDFIENTKGYGEQKGPWKLRPELLFWLNLYRKNLWAIFDRDKAELLTEDSAADPIPNGTQLAFTFIDGNHSPQYVRSDFEMIFEKTVNGGYIALHDYGGALRPTTETIDKILSDYEGRISVEKIDEKFITIIVKKIVD